MIKVSIKKQNGMYSSFECSGHAGFARKGKDIVCSAVSILTINTYNSIDSLTECDIDGSSEDGFVSWNFPCGCNSEASLLMDSMVLGLCQIKDQYNNLLTIEMKEV